MWKINSKTGSGHDSFVKQIGKLFKKKKRIENVSYWRDAKSFEEKLEVVRINGRFEAKHHSQKLPKNYDINELPWHLCN